MNPLHTLIARVLVAVLFTAFYGFITLKVLNRVEDMPDGVKDVAMVLIGALTTSVVTIIAFFFNSSQSSAEKTVALARAAGDKQGTPP